VATGRWLPPPSRLTCILQSPSNSRHGAFGRGSVADPPRFELYERWAAEDGSLAGLGLKRLRPGWTWSGKWRRRESNPRTVPASAGRTRDTLLADCAPMRR